MRELRRACPQRSDRAAIDYCQAIAIVERKSRRQFIVITILKAWMAVAGTPLVIDGQKTNALPANTAQEIRKRQAEEKVRAALAAHRAAMSAASA